MMNYLDLAKFRSLVKVFITSQFNYCPLIWMVHSRQLNHRINKIHEKTLRLVYRDNKKLCFNDPLELSNSVTIHQRNFGTLEIMKKVMKDVFEIKESHYNFRSDASHFKMENIKSTHYDIASVRYLGPETWDSLP